jgi:non-specific serine/threonine protein kinase
MGEQAMSLDDPISETSAALKTAAAVPPGWSLICSDPVLASFPLGVAARVGTRIGLYGNRGSGVAGSGDGGASWMHRAGPWVHAEYPAGCGWDGQFWMMFLSWVFASRTLEDWRTVKDGAVWGPRSGAAAVGFGDQLFLIGGLTESGNPRRKLGDVWVSQDGAGWDCLNPQAFSGRAGAAAGALPFVAGHKLLVMGGASDNGLLAETQVSLDGGRRWTGYPAPWPARANASAVTIGDTLFLARGQNGPGVDLQDIWATQDGINWRCVDSNGPDARSSHAVGVGAHLILVTGPSLDGRRQGDVFTFDPWPAGWSTIAHSDVVAQLTVYPRLLQLNGILYAVQGEPRTPVASSPDGVVWTALPANLPYRQLGAATVHDGKLLVVGGYLRPNWPTMQSNLSSDGVAWDSHDPGLTGVAEHMLVSYHGELILMAGWMSDGRGGGGLTNTKLHSENGYRWGGGRPTDFSARAGGAAVVWRDRIWVMGGKDASGPVADCWQSDEIAFRWTEMLPKPPWAGRYRHVAGVIGDTLYVGLGLGAGDVPLTDVWATDDGVQWRDVTGPVPGPRLRGNFAGAAVDDALLIVGGDSPDPPPDGAIYRYRPAPP